MRLHVLDPIPADTADLAVHIVVVPAYGLLGDAVGIELTIAVIGGVVLLSLPLCLVLRPSLVAPGSASA